MKTRLEEYYRTAVRPALVEKFGYDNELQVPRLEKVIINIQYNDSNKFLQHLAV